VVARNSCGGDDAGEPSPGKDGAALEEDPMPASVPAPCVSFCADMDMYALFEELVVAFELEFSALGSIV
jgi:hypothetical protein